MDVDQGAIYIIFHLIKGTTYDVKESLYYISSVCMLLGVGHGHCNIPATALALEANLA